MSVPPRLTRACGVGIALAVGVAFAVVPAAAQAAPVDLATAGSFVALGGSTVTNTGPSVLNGDLGVAPGTAISGFPPGVVNGATHVDDAFARRAQADLTTAYDVAAAEPAADRSGEDLGAMRLTPGAYRFSSSAQLTGTLTLDAQGDPNAQFVFRIGSTLTTASASRVELVNGASPCNVFWQVGSSATLGTGTAFQGNVLALTSITLDTGASVTGRVLARNGALTLDTNVLDASGCAAGTTSPPPDDTASPSGPDDTTSPTSPADTTSPGPPASPSPSAGAPSGGSATAGAGQAPAPGTATIAAPLRNGTAVIRRTPRERCTEGFRAAVRGHLIKRVVFTLDGKRIGSRATSPFSVFVRAAPGRHQVRARVTFKDATRAKTLTVGYRACAAAVLKPRRGPSQFTG